MEEHTEIDIRIAGLDDRAIQKILREIDMSELVAALKGASGEIRDKIFRNMSKRAAEMAQYEMEQPGAVEVERTKKAVDKINTVMVKLMERGEIVLGEEIRKSPRCG